MSGNANNDSGKKPNITAVSPTAEQLLRFELFCNTRSDADKSLLTLSTAGLGLITTLITSDKISSIFELVVFIIAAIAFVIAIFTILKIFQENAVYISKKNINSKNLNFLDQIAKYAFYIGILLTSIASIMISINSLEARLQNKGYQHEQQEQTRSAYATTTIQSPRERELGGGGINTSTTKTTNPEQGGLIMPDKHDHKLEHEPVEIRKSWDQANAILESDNDQTNSNNDEDDDNSGS